MLIKRVDDAMLIEEDRQQQQSPDDAPTKLVCGEDTTERALTKAPMINIGNSIRTTIAKLIVEMLKHAYEEQLFSDRKQEHR